MPIPNSSSQEFGSGLSMMERREKPRVNCSFPSLISLQNEGDKLEHKAVLANMSVNGMYLRTKSYIPLGEILFVKVRLSTSPLDKRTAPHIAAFGKVLRVEPQPDGTYGIALKLQQHRFT